MTKEGGYLKLAIMIKTFLALRGRRDIIAPKGMKRESSASESGIDEPPKKKSSVRGPSIVQRPTADSAMEIETIRQLTVLDKALRERKMQRFQSLVEARKLSCTILGKTEPFLYFTGLRIVDVVELACLTSMELYSLIEWVSTLSFYPKMTVAHRACSLRRYAIYQLVIETGYCTAKSNYENVWMLPNDTCVSADSVQRVSKIVL